MRIGIDSYCYHRYFGELYPGQEPAPQSMTVAEFVRRAQELRVDGVSLESCFLPSTEKPFLAELKGMLDEAGLDRVYAWGHPDGLEGGKNQDAFKQMMGSFDHAEAIGAKVMRVVGSSLEFRFESHDEQLALLEKMFKEAVKVAEDRDIKMAVENHIDFTADEILRLIESVGSPYFGLNFDTGNFLRLLDDPIKGAEKLAKYTLATHVKDLKPRKDMPADEWCFFSCTPVGDGLVDNYALARLLLAAGFEGFLAVEVDYLHPDYENEDIAVEKSVEELRRIADTVEAEAAQSA
jgi:sugar phosphate isomerase/epimerase